MPRILLHVGIHKTGTTAIQTFAAVNRQELFKRGLWYPNYKPVSEFHQKAHNAFAHSLSGEGDKLTMDQSKALVDYWHEKTQESAHDLLLSAESMSRHVIGPPEKNWVEKRRRYVHALRDLLVPFDVVVVMVLRRQDDFARSMYQEYISQGPRAVSRWIDADLRGKSQWALSFTRFREVLAESVLNYLDNLLLFEEVFGPVKVLLFDDLIKTGQLSNAFLNELGVNTKGLVHPGVVRKSPSYVETLMKRGIWPLAATPRISKWLGRILKWAAEKVANPYIGEFPIEKLWENERARPDFMDNYSEENAKIASRYFPQRSLPLFK